MRWRQKYINALWVTSSVLQLRVAERAGAVQTEMGAEDKAVVGVVRRAAGDWNVRYG